MLQKGTMDKELEEVMDEETTTRQDRAFFCAKHHLNTWGIRVATNIPFDRVVKKAKKDILLLTVKMDPCMMQCTVSEDDYVYCTSAIPIETNVTVLSTAQKKDLYFRLEMSIYNRINSNGDKTAMIRLDHSSFSTTDDELKFCIEINRD